MRELAKVTEYQVALVVKNPPANVGDIRDMGLGGLRELVLDREAGVLRFMESQRVAHN